MDVGLVTAFLGGALALLSPCGALLLPAWFAATAGSGPRLWWHGGLFLLGLLVTLVPLGIGVGALGGLLVSDRAWVIGVAGAVMVTLGVLQVLGAGFDLGARVPGLQRLQGRVATTAGFTRTVLLGVVSGLAGFCAGPILGAVLTVAATRDVPATAVLMSFYALGMVLPLLLLAAVWPRLALADRTRLRGRTFVFLGRRWHTWNVVAGLLTVLAGVLFWATNGFTGVPSVLPIGAQWQVQSWLGSLTGPVVDLLVIVAVAALVLLVWWRLRRRADTDPPSDPSTDGPVTKDIER